jgi:hypothetical protein
MLDALPLGYTEEAFTAADRADAANALDSGAAVWDPSALAMAVAFDEPLGDALRAAFPLATVAQATLDDAAIVLAEPSSGAPMQATIDAAGELRLWEWSSEDLGVMRSRAERRLRMAQTMTVRPDRDPSRSDVLDRLTAASELPVQSRTWPATLIVARRYDVAVYSDDRYVRLSARQSGLRAFGTLALTDVLRGRGAIDGDAATQMRTWLTHRGAWGLSMSGEEMLALAREAGFEPTHGVRVAFSDVWQWRATRLEMFDGLFVFLEGVLHDAPATFPRWVHRVVDSASLSLANKLDYTTWGRALLSLALNPFTEPVRMSDAGLRALIDAVRGLEWFRIYRTDDDIVLEALGQLLVNVPGEDRVRAFLFKKATERLSHSDRDAAYARFVR